MWQAILAVLKTIKVSFKFIDTDLSDRDAKVGVCITIGTVDIDIGITISW